MGTTIRPKLKAIDCCHLQFAKMIFVSATKTAGLEEAMITRLGKHSSMNFKYLIFLLFSALFSATSKIIVSMSIKYQITTKWEPK
jgi:hypothetical protein